MQNDQPQNEILVYSCIHNSVFRYSCPSWRIQSCKRFGCVQNSFISWEKFGNNQGIKIKRHTEIPCVITLQWYIFNMPFLYRWCWKLSNACIDQLWWFSLMDYADFLQLHCLHVQLHLQSYSMCLLTHYWHQLFLSAFIYFPKVLLEVGDTYS